VDPCLLLFFPVYNNLLGWISIPLSLSLINIWRNFYNVQCM
jgi:hypothetical protein